jgi:hypothetical protein
LFSSSISRSTLWFVRRCLDSRGCHDVGVVLGSTESFTGRGSGPESELSLVDSLVVGFFLRCCFLFALDLLVPICIKQKDASSDTRSVPTPLIESELTEEAHWNLRPKKLLPQPGLEPDSSVPALRDTAVLAYYITEASRRSLPSTIYLFSIRSTFPIRSLSYHFRGLFNLSHCFIPFVSFQVICGS